MPKHAKQPLGGVSRGIYQSINPVRFENSGLGVVSPEHKGERVAVCTATTVPPPEPGVTISQERKRRLLIRCFFATARTEAIEQLIQFGYKHRESPLVLLFQDQFANFLNSLSCRLV